MAYLIPQSEPLIQVKKTAKNRYSIQPSQSFKNFAESIPKHRRKNMTVRFIPKNSPEGQAIMKQMQEE